MLLILGALHTVHERRLPGFVWLAEPLRRWVHTGRAFSSSVGLIPKAKVAMTFVQVVAVLDSTYAITLPQSWYDWTTVIRFFGRLDWAN
eukprot:822933-Prymnesium_polylepis.1